MNPLSEKPRVVIDGRMLGPTPHGFSRYVSQLASGLSKLRAEQPLPYEVVFLIRAGTAPQALAGFQTCEVGARFLNPLELVELPLVLRKLGAALYHSPTFSSLLTCPCPWVITVHDLNHLHYGGYKEKLYYERLLKPFVQKAQAVISVSDFSRKEVGAWAALDSNYIDIVYNAIDPVFQERVDPLLVSQVVARFELRHGKYFFSLSNTKPHKNLKRLVEAYGTYRVDADSWDLALNLKPGDLSAAPGLKLLGPPTDQEARALMAGSGAVVFPSLYEGFGLPPVEAACLGVPVVASRIAPHREGLADLEQGEVLWVDPLDTGAWNRAFERTATGGVLGASVESRSRLLNRFSSFKMAAHMDRIYRRVLRIAL